MEDINAFNLMGKLIAIHNNMPNEYLNKVIGESIDCIEKQNQKISDHKAVVETMQNKIEELETDNKKLLLELEDRRNDLLETKGLVKICKGAGQCDYDGSTCNKYDNCGEYDPVIRGIAKGIK